MNLRSGVVQIRPQLGIDYDIENANEELIFQNEVLRPILKFQDSLFQLIFTFELQSKRIRLDQMIDAEIRLKIKSMIMNDVPLKNKLLGICLGMLTRDEVGFYLKNQKSLNKRILSMLVERIHDHFKFST